MLAGEEDVEWNEKNMVGNTPFLTAMRENNTDMVKTLLKIPSVDINVKDRHGKCLLNLASAKNNLQLVNIIFRTRYFKPLDCNFYFKKRTFKQDLSASPYSCLLQISKYLSGCVGEA